VEALKENGEVVAMMGDGVNDAPALKKADIGVVVGEASDVAKETADLVLLDSSFETLVSAIEEGRGIFDNIRKIILYLMSDAFSEIVAVVGTLILGLPLAVTAGQILWINLVSDGFPDLALTIDPKADDIMQRKPKPPWEPITTRWMKLLIGIVSFVGGIIGLIAFVYYYNVTKDEVLARSVTFAVLGLNSLVYVFSVRTLTKPFWVENPLENKWLNAAVFVGLILQFIPFSTPYLRGFFGLKFPGMGPILMAFLAAIFVFIMIETLKAIVRKHLEWFQH
jgi:Ca2+-transporting ATPase